MNTRHVSALAFLALLFLLPARTQEAPPRGYSILLVDLAGETHRQVLVDREPGPEMNLPTS